MKGNLFLLKILQTGQEIMELDTSGFATQGPTVFAGNIGDNQYIIQVSPMGLRLLEGGEGRLDPVNIRDGYRQESNQTTPLIDTDC